MGIRIDFIKDCITYYIFTFQKMLKLEERYGEKIRLYSDIFS